MSWTPQLTYELLDFDGSSFGAFEVRGDHEPSGLIALSSTGQGELAVDAGDGDISTFPSSFRWGRYVQVFRDGSPIFVWRIEDSNPERDERNEQGWLELSGRGWIADWDYALVRPARGNNQKPAPDQRVFNFATPGCPITFTWDQPVDHGAWSAAHPHYVMLDAAEQVAAAPISWRDYDARWVWPMDPSNVAGDAYFVAEFNLAEETDVRFDCTGDNYYTVYLDGVPIMSEQDNLACWMEFRRADKVIQAGDHTIGIKVTNPEVAGIVNVAGMLFSCYTKDADENPVTILLRSQAGAEWRCLFVDAGDPAPGWTPAEILDELVVAAHNAGEIADWSLNFGTTEDTAGTTWPMVPHIAFGVGESLLKALQKLADLGWLDYLAPVELSATETPPKRLNAWVAGGATSSGVTLRDLTNSADPETGSDIELTDPDMSNGGEPPYNNYLVRFPGAYIEVTGDTTDGVFSALLSTDARDPIEAQRNGQRALEQTDPTMQPVSWTVEPLGPTTTPTDGFTIRDTVNVPDADGNMAARRCVAIAWQDIEHEPQWNVTWQRRRRTKRTRESQRVNSLGSVVQGKAPGSEPKSATQTAQPTSPSDKPVIESKVVRGPTVADFPSGGPGGGGGGVYPDLDWTVGPVVAVSADTELHRFRRSYEFHCYYHRLHLVEASAFDYTVNLLLDGVQVATITIGAGDTEVGDPLNIDVDGELISAELEECTEGTGVRLTYTVMCNPVPL